jgi:chemotaxis protein CheD
MSIAVAKRKVVGIADLVVSDNPEDLLVTYSLGSCLAVVLYDHKAQIGGMLHAMLPDSKLEKLSKDSIAFNPYKYIDTGVPALFKKCYKLGANQRNLSLSVFGGAQVFDHEDYFNIGKRNYVALRKIIWKEGVLIKHEHVGGRVHRTVRLNISNGEILLDVNKDELITYDASD